MKGSAYYDEMYETRQGRRLCGSKLSFHENHFATQVMKKHCLHGRWLDLGCGCGQKAWHVAAANPVEIVGLDFSPAAVRYMRALPPHGGPGRLQWMCGDIMALPFRSASFDGCICSHVLEHVEATHRLLTEVMRITGPGGCLVVIVPHLHYADDPSHVWHFTPAHLTSTLFAYGAVSVKMSPSGNQIAAAVYFGGPDDN